MSTRNELPTLSIVMIVKNEAHQIERTLKKLDWADEIVVIDAFSTDGTMDVCRKYASRIYQLPWEGFSKQRQISIDLAKGQWVFRDLSWRFSQLFIRRPFTQRSGNN